MPNFVCATCGTVYPPAAAAPAHCPICEDERQHLPPDGQVWTTLEALRETHRNDIRELEPGLFGIGATPAIAIGQRALLVAQPGGGVLWDCTPLLTDETVDFVERNGGLRAIAISHPHFHTAMVEWSEAFGDVPIYLHESNRQYVVRPDRRILYWSSETRELGQGVALIRCGGHFEGSTVLHWAAGAGGRGALMTGDTIAVMPDTRWLSFMYSYPNLIPLPAREVRRIAACVEAVAFDRIYGGWWDRVCGRDAGARLSASVERYCAAIAE